MHPDRRRSAPALACALLALPLLLPGAAGAQDENPTQVTLEKEALFAGPDGEEVRVAPGAYQVTASGESDLALTPAAGGEGIVLGAEAGSEEEAVEEPVALYTGGDDEAGTARHLVLVLPDGSRRETVGSVGAVLERGARRVRLAPKKKRRLVLKKIGKVGGGRKKASGPGGRAPKPRPARPRPAATQGGTSQQASPLAPLTPPSLPAGAFQLPSVPTDTRKSVTGDPQNDPACQAAGFAFLGCTAPIALAGGCVRGADDEAWIRCMHAHDADGYQRCVELSNICPTCGCRVEPGGPGGNTGGACTWRTSQIIDRRIDVTAQYSLMRMMRRGGAERRDASAMIGAAKSDQIEGIYRPGLKVTVDRGQRMTPPRPYWEFLKGQPSACLLEPAGEPPMIVYREKMPDAQTDRALRDAWAQCGLPTPDPPCNYIVDSRKPDACSSWSKTYGTCEEGRTGCDLAPGCNGNVGKCNDEDFDAFFRCVEASPGNSDRCIEEADRAHPNCVVPVAGGF